MISALILIFIILCIKPLFFYLPVQRLAQFLHEECVQNIVGGNEALTPIYSALVCGERLPEGILKKTFMSLGIIHLMVISGAHLIFIEKAWSLLPHFRFKNASLVFFLLVYALSAGLSPPILRALFSFLLARINKKWKLFWSPYTRVHISGLLCLLCQHTWIHSLSLQLSWVASLGMSNPRLSRCKSCILTYLLILPLVSSWSNAHPFSIIINWLIAPLASSILLPLSLLTLPFPFLRFFTDIVWGWFLQLLYFLKPLTEHRGIEFISLNSYAIWVYIALLFIILDKCFVYYRRWQCSLEEGVSK